MRSTAAALLLSPCLVLLPGSAGAVFQTFSDRAAWEAAVASAGLGVVTEDFTSDPGSTFSVGGIAFERAAGTHDAGDGRIEGFSFRFDFTGGGTLYGIGIDLGQETGAPSTLVAVRTRDTNGLFGQQGTFLSSGNTFAGVLSDVPLSTVCGTVLTCPNFGQAEIYLSGQISATPFTDNLSVAVMSPAVAMPALATRMRIALGLALAVLALPLASRPLRARRPRS